MAEHDATLLQALQALCELLRRCMRFGFKDCCREEPYAEAEGQEQGYAFHNSCVSFGYFK